MPQRLLLEGPDIDELLERVRVEHGPDARIVHAEQKLVGGVAGFFARRRFEVAVAVDEDTARVASVPAAPASIEDLLALADAQDGSEPRPVPEPAAPSTAVQRAPGRKVSTETASFDHFVRDLISRAEGGPLHAPPTAAQVEVPDAFAPDAFVPDTFVPATLRVEPPVEQPVEQPAQACQDDAPDVAPAARRDDARLALLDTLAAAAVQPPRRLAGTQVVVGPAEQARAVARAWLEACGEDDAALVDVSAARTLLSEASARHDVIVVVETDGRTAQARRAGRVVAELRALAVTAVTAVTAVVDARWDVATTRAWLAALAEQGQPADHLAAHGLDDAAQPLRLLDLGVQVTWLDARPATLGAWAAPCLDRL